MLYLNVKYAWRRYTMYKHALPMLLVDSVTHLRKLYWKRLATSLVSSEYKGQSLLYSSFESTFGAIVIVGIDCSLQLSCSVAVRCGARL